MNTMNRILVILMLLVAMLVCTVVLVLPAFNVSVLDTVGERLAELADSLDQMKAVWRVVLGILFALVVNIVLGLLVVFEVRRPSPKFIRVEKAAGGEVQVSIASIADRLRYEVDGLASVLRAKAKVSARRKGVVVQLDVEIAAGLDVPVKADQIVETARLVIEDKMGLKLARPPKVTMRAIPYPKALGIRTPGSLETPEEPAQEPAFDEPSFAEPQYDLPELPED